MGSGLLCLVNVQSIIGLALYLSLSLLLTERHTNF